MGPQKSARGVPARRSLGDDRLFLWVPAPFCEPDTTDLALGLDALSPAVQSGTQQTDSADRPFPCLVPSETDRRGAEEWEQARAAFCFGRDFVLHRRCTRFATARVAFRISIPRFRHGLVPLGQTSRAHSIFSDRAAFFHDPAR